MSPASAAVHVRVLGELDVAVDGQRVTVGGDRQRSLLVALALAGPDGLSVERAIEQVWGVESDDLHVGHVRTTVSRLRRQLDAATLETRPGGYRLARGRVAVDAWHFDDLVARAHDEADDEERRLLLSAALALWRGPVAVHTTGAVATSPAARGLVARRLDAEEALLALQLRSDEHARVADRAAQLLVDHPYREGLRVLQVRALAAGGRTAAALAAVREHRQVLAEDLGLDPLSEIAELERALLGADRLEPQPTDGRFRGYELGRVLQRSPTSTVHVARQPVLGREVLLTTVWGSFARDPSSGRRLEEFTQRLERLEEPGIVAPLDGWREAGRLHLVEPLLRPIPDALDDVAVADLVSRIGRALRALHGMGVVHGGIDGATVRTGPDERAVLVGTTSTWARQGTTGAAGQAGPPEQDPRDDVAGLAALASSLLVGDGPGASGLHAAVATVVAGRGGLDLLLDAADEVLASATGQLPGASGPGGDRDTATMPLRNPYRGLAAFGTGDSDVFAGREDVVDEIAAMLVDEGRDLVVVTGPSGVGKSSLLAAGVLPALEHRTIGGTRPRIAALRPGEDPHAALAAALVAVASAPTGPATAALRAGNGSWAAAVEEVAADNSIVVGIDQLEELWAQADGGRRFLDLLADVATHPRTQLVAAVRVDRLSPLLTNPRLGTAARRALWALGPLDAVGIEAAIRRPAEAAGIEVEPGLVAALLRGMAENPTALPLLQLTLTTLVERADRPRLDRAAYDELGGLGGAVVARGQALLDGAATPDDVRRLFAQLMTVDANGNVTRRQERLADVVAVVPRAVVEEAVETRLLTLSRDAATREPVVDVSHDAIFESWPVMRSWIEEDRDLLRARTTMLAAAVLWQEEGEPDERLLHGAPLARAQELLDADVPLPSVARTFVERSVARSDARRHQERRRRRRERRIFRIAVAAAIISTLLATVAVVQQNTVADQAVELQTASLLRAVEVVAAEHPILAGQLAVHAVRLDDTPATRAAVVRAVTAEPRVLRQLADLGPVSCPAITPGVESGVVLGATLVAPDGRPQGRVAALPADDAWEFELPSPTACLEPAPTADGALATVGTRVEVVRRATSASGTLEGVLDATWSPDGRVVHALVAGPVGVVLRTHAVDDLELVAEHPLQVPFAASVSATERLAVVAGPSSPPIVVDLMSGDRRTLARSGGSALVAVAAGEAVVGASRDRLLRWDDSGVRAVPLTGTDPTSVVVTPDGTVAAVSTSVGVEFVDLDEMRLLGNALLLPGASAAPVSADTLAVVSADGSAVEVEVRRRERLGQRRGPVGELGVVAGDLVALADATSWRLLPGDDPAVVLGRRDAKVRLLDHGGAVVVEPRGAIREVRSDGTLVTSVDLSDRWTDGEDDTLFSSSLLRGWPAVVGSLVTVPHRTEAGSEPTWQVLVVDLTAGVVRLDLQVDDLAAATPLDDERVVVADATGVLSMLDLGGTEQHQIEVGGVPTTVLADGDDVLVGLADGGVIRWEPGEAPVVVSRGVSRDAVLSLAIDDEGRILAAHASGRLVLLVEGQAETAALLGPGELGGPVSVSGAVASLLHGGAVVDVPLDLVTWIEAACLRSGVPIDADEWRAATGVQPPEVNPCTSSPTG